MATDDPLSNGEASEWEGYSDYQAVSRSVGRSVSKAIENYAWLDAIHRDGGNPAADQIAMARSAVLSAALKLFVEMREEKGNGNDEYDDILERWTGDEDLPEDELLEFDDVWDGCGKMPTSGNGHANANGAAQPQNGTEGYLRAFQSVELDERVPAWTIQFVTDIRTAGFRLGYLQAGRRSRKEAEDPVEADAQAMLRGS